MKEPQTAGLEYYILDMRLAEHETGTHNHTTNLRFKQY